ncbi:MAG: DNA polymerase IV [Firmicutes bacterium]|nr:DNA polymerase IV [Bacillota bacterium]
MAVIMHVDMDSFFASVEQRDHPELRGKPVIIGGRKDSRRGVVSTCSYEARKFGVHSAMPIGQAVRLCPDGIFLPGNHDKYEKISKEIRQVFAKFSPVVENLSIDEAFLDMTGCEHLHRSLPAMGNAVKQAIYDAVQLSASVGIAPNKFVAKLASDYRKPDGLTIIALEQIKDWLAPMPVTNIWGIGEKTAEILAAWQIHTIQELRHCSKTQLIQYFGKHGRNLYWLARGVDHRAVEPDTEAKSMGKETTFRENVTDTAVLRQVLAKLVALVGARLRKNGLWARTITIKLRYSDFTTITRSSSLPQPINSDDTIFETADRLLKKNRGTAPVRLIGVYVTQLTTVTQATLFSDPREDKLTKLMDQLNTRYDKPILRKGREL